MTEEASAPIGMNDRVNRWVAISVALVSVFLGVAKVKDDNICQAMQEAKSRMVDTWNEYQAKKIKHHLDEASAFQLELQLPSLPPEIRAKASERRDLLLSHVTRYTDEEVKLRAQAEGFDKKYDDLNFVDDQFDLADAALSMSLGLLAVAALIGSMWLLRFSWIFIAFGVLEGLSAFCGWGFHPDWLMNFLS